MSPTAGLDHMVSLSWCFQSSRQCTHETVLVVDHSIARNSPPDQLIAPPADLVAADQDVEATVTVDVVQRW